LTLFGYKDYQQRTLQALSEYLALARDMGAKKAFIYQTERAYHPVAQLPGLPYVCLRVPTGGGKTVLACHSIAVALRDFLRQERGIVLWLAPTNTIKDQTLRALRDKAHPYRQVLDATLDGRVTAMDLTEALSLPRALPDGETVIILSTMAALRVEDTAGRKVYDQSGALMAHFENLPPEVTARLEKYDGKNEPIPSLANVLKMRRPLVIVDEAHHLRTDLSFDTLARFDPSCILEFTATPHTGEAPSNVLYQVSAAELKAESMIKLPLRVQLHGVWSEAVAGAIAAQKSLEEAAQTEQATHNTSYLRPIVLLQAQPKNQPHTVEAVKQHLLDSQIPVEQIAIETGTIHELDGVNLFAPTCPVRYIITVDKLREGWDCPFAYILCSVRDMTSSTAIEQILGRVLRMPNAERRPSPVLNDAYAFVTSRNYRQVADSLSGALVANGLTRYEAAQEIKQTELDYGGLFGPPKDAERKTPAQRGEPFTVPQLALLTDETEWEPVDEDTFSRLADWNLSPADAALSPQNFPDRIAAEAYTLDVTAQGTASIQQSESLFADELARQLALLAPDDLSTPAELAVWLDRHIPHPDLTQTQTSLFLLRLIENLIAERGLTLPQLSRERGRLRAAAAKINDLRRSAIRTAAQQLLFDAPPADLQTRPDCVFSFAPDQYPASELYEGSYQFARHYYPVVGAMNGEETDCARALDTHPLVRHWVRNLERRPATSFWLQTTSDKFYPDFLALLTDSRILAVEYKGEHLASNDDTKEKQAIGDLWAARSHGRCLFHLVGKTDYQSALQSLTPG
jgi:type III restriction enzyme